jgi:lysophospholipase L1-like esterase
VFLLRQFPGISFTHLAGFVDQYYPMLKDIQHSTSNSKDETFDILLLGGSVLHPNNGEIEEELQKQLAALGKKQVVKIYNASMPGHTSRDSKFKMDLLQQQHFDLVIFYHGINDVRANNCTPDVFQEDYSHFKWYDELNGIIDIQGEASMALPIAANYWRITLQQRIFPHSYIPREIPRKGWSDYGAEVKTENSFRKNLESIYRHTQSINCPLLLATFTWYLPDNYSFEYFEETKNRDSRPRFPVKIWGKAPNVIKGIQAHNQVEKDFAEKEKDLLLVDLHAQMPKGEQYFDDICHLSKAGSQEFARILVKEITPLLD